MSYKYVNNRGFVIRDSDGKIVAPCQSSEDPDFIEYNEWVAAGNEPLLVEPEDVGVE